MIDMTSAIALVATHSVNVTRFPVDAYDSQGRALARAVGSTFSVRANVQPSNEPTNRDDTRGISSSNFVRVFAIGDLRSRDRLSIPGLGVFEVDRVLNWQSNGHYSEVIAKQLDSPREPRPEVLESPGETVSVSFGSPRVLP